MWEKIIGQQLPRNSGTSYQTFKLLFGLHAFLIYQAQFSGLKNLEWVKTIWNELIYHQVDHGRDVQETMIRRRGIKTNNESASIWKTELLHNFRLISEIKSQASSSDWFNETRSYNVTQRSSMNEQLLTCRVGGCWRSHNATHERCQ